MTLEEYAKQQRQETVRQDFKRPEPEAKPPAPTDTAPIAATQRIIREYKLNKQIAEGCRLQILQDIQEKQNPYRMLLTAAEAIGRLDFGGDGFFLQVQQKLIEVYGRDISQDTPET